MDNLPAGHISTDDAIKMLEKHTASKPLVDLPFMLDNIRFMNSARNYTMKLMQKDAKGKYYSAMHVAVVVRTDRDLENLKYAIKEANKRVTGKFVEPEKKVEKITTQIDDLDGSSEKARVNTKSATKYGDKVQTGSKTIHPTEEK